MFIVSATDLVTSSPWKNDIVCENKTDALRHANRLFHVALSCSKNPVRVTVWDEVDEYSYEETT